MAWTAGTYAGTWFTGTGPRRKDVVGACRAALPNGYTHMMRFDSVDSFLGIEWSTGTNYAMGYWQESPDGNHQFMVQQTATEADWNRCYGQIDNSPVVTQPTEPNEPPTFNPFTGRYDTPITENLDWRLVAAVALIALTGLYALYISQK